MKEPINNRLKFAIFKPDNRNGELYKVSTWREFRQVQIEENWKVSRKTHR
jgi:hypothetical protein